MSDKNYGDLAEKADEAYEDFMTGRYCSEKRLTWKDAEKEEDAAWREILKLDSENGT